MNMFNIGSSVVNKATLKHATISNVLVEENILESRGYNEPRVEVQYSDGIREWLPMSQVQHMLVEG
tara:strand:+ start:288 stop:485 length:198 start_codon:yes stop_codon:yes gene_type:complete